MDASFFAEWTESLCEHFQMADENHKAANQNILVKLQLWPTNLRLVNLAGIRSAKTAIHIQGEE